MRTSHFNYFTHMNIQDSQEAFRAGWEIMTDVVYANHVAKGWTKDSRPNDPLWQGNQMALLHGEISEAHEAIRKDLMDDKVPHRKGVEVELADEIIRIMNFARECGLDIPGALFDKHEFNTGRPFMHGDKKF